jgi:hypothetical protein
LWRRDTPTQSHISEKQKLNISAQGTGQAEQFERVGEIAFKNIRAAMAGRVRVVQDVDEIARRANHN